MTTHPQDDNFKMIAILGVAVLLFMLLTVGCRTYGVKSDDFPAGVPCVQARADAINWYQGKWHVAPSVPAVRVIVTPTPPQGQGGLTSGSGNGYIIQIWKDQNPFYGSLVHEFRHCLCGNNGKGMSEEAVR